MNKVMPYQIMIMDRNISLKNRLIFCLHCYGLDSQRKRYRFLKVMLHKLGIAVIVTGREYTEYSSEQFYFAEKMLYSENKYSNGSAIAMHIANAALSLDLEIDLITSIDIYFRNN